MCSHEYCSVTTSMHIYAMLKDIYIYMSRISSLLHGFVCGCVGVLLENAVFVCITAMVYSHHESAGNLAH